MRITSSMYYNNLFGPSNSKLSQNLFDVNKQISSGQKIEYAKDDVQVFSETMRLDNEVTALKQVKSSTQSGLKVSDQTDTVLNEFETSTDRFRTLLINAANGTNDDTSLDAIAQELKGIRHNLKDLSNTSINGQYLFSGSAIDVKPISEDGTYNGNNGSRNAVLGSQSTQQYNLSGAELFLGENSSIKREISTNVHQTSNVGHALNKDTTMADFMGVVPTGHQHHFYLRGFSHDGTSINKDITLNNNDTIDSLLSNIGKEYGNSGALKVVNVTMNDSGEIIVQDKIKGSSKLDFHMVGASDFGGSDEAVATNINQLDQGSTDYNTALTSANKLYVREFNKSPYTVATGGPTLTGSAYDRTEFTVSGSSVSSSISQINKDTNSFATTSTKLSDVADLSQGNNGTLDGTSFDLKGKDVSGNSYSATINLKSSANGGSNFTIGSNTYTIYNADNPQTAVDADKMTYQQLMDVMNMVVTNKLPASNSANDYNSAITDSNTLGDTSLSYDGKIKFNDLQNSSTQASISLNDSNSGSFNSGEASVMTFNANNTLAVRDPKTDFFKTIDEAIQAVQDHKVNPDGSSGHMRNIGIENAIAQIDDLKNHISRNHAQVGVNSNTLTNALDRTNILEVSTKSLRSSVIDTDLATSALRLQQLTTNYQSMLSTVGKVSKLSLVNYL